MQEFKSKTKEYEYEEDDLNFHEETITLLYKPGHCDILYSKEDPKDYPLLIEYDNLKSGTKNGSSKYLSEIFIREEQKEIAEVKSIGNSIIKNGKEGKLIEECSEEAVEEWRVSRRKRK